MLRIATHNVWNNIDNTPAWEKNGEDCSAGARAPGHVRVYKETMPDIIGWQESRDIMLDLVLEGCREAGIEYTAVWGRFTPILYRADKLELLESKFITYPDDIDGFEGIFNDMRSKSANIAVFRIKENGHIFVFTTTHLWWKRNDEATRVNDPASYQEGSDKAREIQLKMIVDTVAPFREKYGAPSIILGDFNTQYDSLAVKYALDHGYRHAHDIATAFADEEMGYHLCFPWGYVKKYMTDGFKKALDHIVISGEPEGAVKRFERYSPDYYFPISDHSMAFIDAEL